METLDAKATADHLPYLDLAYSIREVAPAVGSGELQAPPRLAKKLTG